MRGMNFKNKHYISEGVNSKVSLLLQLFMWQCIYEMPPPKDYLQVFKCSVYDGKQKVTHIQEVPEYQREYLINMDAPFFVGKIFVIDDETHSTMILAEEY